MLTKYILNICQIQKIIFLCLAFSNIFPLSVYASSFLSKKTYVSKTTNQISKVKERKFLINSNIHKLVIIHGRGEGVLKKEVHSLLKRYQLRYFESLNGGSTDVMI